jgi:Zn ribbon nucleic-acid-binding protein
MRFGATRTCSECNEFALEATEDVNIFECLNCGSVWKRLKPFYDEEGNFKNIPDKLNRLFSLNNVNQPSVKKLFEKKVEEFELAWEEFFRDKPAPRNDDEDIKQQKEFSYWYNCVRKQSDTNLTPKEMLDSGIENRMFEFSFDEEDEDFYEEEP